jgi:hypothetical protein
LKNLNPSLHSVTDNPVFKSWKKAFYAEKNGKEIKNVALPILTGGNPQDRRHAMPQKHQNPVV